MCTFLAGREIDTRDELWYCMEEAEMNIPGVRSDEGRQVMGPPSSLLRLPLEDCILFELAVITTTKKRNAGNYRSGLRVG